MKKLLVLGAVLALGFGGGCSFDKRDREDAARAAVTLASQRLASAVKEELIKEGVDPVAAQKVADIMVAKASAIAERVIERD